MPVMVYVTAFFVVCAVLCLIAAIDGYFKGRAGDYDANNNSMIAGAFFVVFALAALISWCITHFFHG